MSREVFRIQMQVKAHFCWGVFLFISSTGLVFAQSDTFNLVVNIKQIEDRKFFTQASFNLPLKQCQAWKYLIDYDSASSIPGVISSRTTRLSGNKAQVKLVMEENILFFSIRMNSVIDFEETKNQGTDFIQIAGEAKSFQGSWRIEPKDNGTLFRYHSVFQPDSALPMVVIKYFFDRRLKNSFAAIAQIGSTKQDAVCD
jgi:hypothetical protein